MPNPQGFAGDNRRRDDASSLTYHGAFCIAPRTSNALHEGSIIFQKKPLKRTSQFDYLCEKLRHLRDQNPADLNMGNHRTVTSLRRPDAALDTSPNSSFISAWISFNAAYARNLGSDPGGATWGRRVNRNRVQDGGEILQCLMPAFIDTMISTADRNWGIAHYPVIN